MAVSLEATVRELRYTGEITVKYLTFAWLAAILWSGGGAQPGAAAAYYRGATRSPAIWTNVDRIVAVGDVHGDYDQLAATLKSAGLIDDQGNWTGGKTHLVQVGDVLDRGPDSRKAMDLLMRLEKQAPGGGRLRPCADRQSRGHERVRRSALHVGGGFRRVSR